MQCLAPFTQRGIIYVVACVSVLHFFLLNCMEETHFYLFIHGNLCCCTFLTIVNNAGRIFVYKLLYKAVFSFLLGLYLGVELLGHMVTLCLNS